MLPGLGSVEKSNEDIVYWQNQYNNQNAHNQFYNYQQNSQNVHQNNIPNLPSNNQMENYEPNYGQIHNPSYIEAYPSQTQSLGYPNTQSLEQYNNPQSQQYQSTDLSINESHNVQTMDRNIKKKHKESFKKTPCHNFKKSRQNRLNERPSSRNSMASEMSTSQTYGKNKNDHYIKWYQMLVNYYKQYYPDFQLPDIRNMNQTDFGAYCYQFYMQAQKNWSENMGMMMPNYMVTAKQVPYLYRGPHLRVNIYLPGLVLITLPTRPADGQPSRLELVAMNDIANDAIANAGIRASELVLQERKEFEISQQLENSLYASSTNVSTGGMSIQMDGSSMNDLESEQRKTREAKYYADITVTWDRVDNEFYPGPLSAKRSLKLDLLAFLKDKANDIEDRMPIDWESIILFIKLIEIMIKNNGMLHTSEICQLLLEGQERRHMGLMDTTHLVTNSNSFSGHISGERSYQHQQNNLINQSFDGTNQNQSMDQATNGNSTPNHGNNNVKLKRSDSIASSSLSEIQLNQNAGNLQSLLRKLALKTDRSTDSSALEKFRQLLMSGLTVKAVDYACKAKLWGHAFTLAYQLSDPNFPQCDVNLLQRVTKAFIANSIVPTDPISSLYQTLGNEQPQIINSISFSAGADLNEWRPHVAMLLSAKTYRPALVIKSIEHLGDSLLAKKLTFASHICYLISEQLSFENNPNYESVWADDNLKILSNWSRLPGKIWLIGLSKLANEFDPFNFDNAVEFNGSLRTTSEDYEDIGIYPTECVQFTEIYEYCLRLRMYNSQQSLGTTCLGQLNLRKNFIFIHLLPYKLAYAIRLLDAGIVEASYHYLLVCADAFVKFILVSTLTPSQYQISSIYQNFNSSEGIESLDVARFPRETLICFYQLADVITKLLSKLQSYPDLDWIQIMDQLDEENELNRLPDEVPLEPITLTIVKRIQNVLCRLLNLPLVWPHLLDSNYNGLVSQSHTKADLKETMPTIERNLEKLNLTHDNPPMIDSRKTSFIGQRQQRDLQQTFKKEPETPIDDRNTTPTFRDAKTPVPPPVSSANTGFFNPMSEDNSTQNDSQQPFNFFSNVPLTRHRNPSSSSHVSGATSTSQQQRFSFSNSPDENSFSQGTYHTGPPQSPLQKLSSLDESSVSLASSPPRPFTTPSLTQHQYATSNHNQQPMPNKSQSPTQQPQPVVPIKSVESKTIPDDQDNQTEKNNGWFGGIMSKLKKKSNLPDDSKSTIYYDENLKRWVDRNDPTGGDDCPMPPPANPGLLTSKNDTATTQPNPSMPLLNNQQQPNLGFAKTRTRYVNVLQQSGQTNTQTSNNIPLPP